MASTPNDQRPIVIRRIKKAGHGGHHGGAWKVAYADFVTAMMAFFLLLWLVSNQEDNRLKGLAEYFTPSEPTAPVGRDLASKTAALSPGSTREMIAQASGETGAQRGGTAAVPDTTLRVMAQELKLAVDSMAAEEDAKENVLVEESRDGIRISLMDTAARSMFQGSSAELNGFARNLLQKVARHLQPLSTRIALEGHTDAGGGLSDANWALSGARADTARRTMQAAGISPDRFAEVVAMAATRPAFPAEPTRPENRRITIVVLAEAGALPTDVSFGF